MDMRGHGGIWGGYGGVGRGGCVLRVMQRQSDGLANDTSASFGPWVSGPGLLGLLLLVPWLPGPQALIWPWVWSSGPSFHATLAPLCPWTIGPWAKGPMGLYTLDTGPSLR